MAGASQLVKELREKTGAGILDCQKALQESGDDIEKAIDYLRQKGLAAAQKKSGRETNQGLIHAYIHMGGKIGVLIEVNCETDFVARNEEFKAFVNDLALQVAAAKPSYVKREDIPKDVVDKERAIYEGQARLGGGGLPSRRKRSAPSEPMSQPGLASAGMARHWVGTPVISADHECSRRREAAGALRWPAHATGRTPSRRQVMLQ